MASGALVLILALQLALPYRSAMPIDNALAPRRARPVAETPLPTYSTLMESPIFAPDRSPGGSGASGPAGPASLAADGFATPAPARHSAPRVPAYPAGQLACGYLPRTALPPPWARLPVNVLSVTDNVARPFSTAPP